MEDALLCGLISFSEWLLTGAVTQLVVAIISKDSRTPMERWVFDINLVEQPTEGSETYVSILSMAVRQSSKEKTRSLELLQSPKPRFKPRFALFSSKLYRP